MATSLKDYSHKLPRKLICVLACILCFSSAAAEQFNDPTRPAIELVPGLAAIAAPAAPRRIAVGDHFLETRSGDHQWCRNRGGAEIRRFRVDYGERNLRGTDGTSGATGDAYVPHREHEQKRTGHATSGPAMQPVRQGCQRTSEEKQNETKARAKKHAITCVADDIKNGSGK